MPRTDPHRAIKRTLGQLYPEAKCSLTFRNPFELLVATILSAQCTDARVNQITPLLFDHFPDASALAGAKLTELESLIHSTGFFRAKARHLLGMAQALVARHGGEVPANLEDLTALPGVGRKTAHVVLGNALGIASGVVVDTHVKRLAFRFGWTESTDPARVERDLAARFPKSQWRDLSHRLIEHGRRVCLSSRPRCSTCPLLDDCPGHGVSRLPSTTLPT
ncbi:hypothetical protein BH23PLA1_BH23PLA1_11560 [soil metagenome]